MTSAPEWTRVIVLSPPGEPLAVPGAPGAAVVAAASASTDHRGGEGAARCLTVAMRAAFTARDWFPIERHDPHVAMAELCLRERAQAARAAWGLHRMEQMALVVMEPQHWEDLNDLVNAVRQYLPAVTLWQASSDDDEPRPLEAAAGLAIAPRAAALRHGAKNLSSTSPDEPRSRPQWMRSAASVSESAFDSPAASVENAPPAAAAKVVAHAADSCAHRQSDHEGDAHRLTREEIDMLLATHGSEGGA